MSHDVRTLIYGHRGASADHPENTLEAFRGALTQGADGVELDVRVAIDGSLIVHHDAWYRDGRTLFGEGDPGRPTGVPTLAEALDVCAGVRVNVEIKNTPGDLGEGVEWRAEAADAVARLLAERRDAGSADDVLVSSFDAPTLARFREVAPEIATGFLVFDIDREPDAPERAAAAGHAALHPWEHVVTAPLLERCRRAGIEVNTWTVDDPARIRELAELGVDGIITNVPATARRALGRPPV